MFVVYMLFVRDVIDVCQFVVCMLFVSDVKTVCQCLLFTCCLSLTSRLYVNVCCLLVM